MGAIQITKSIKNIPTLPAIIIQIIKTTNDPTSSARDLNKIITNDQAISAKVLQLANSPFYGLSSRVTNLNRAITLLGFNTVRSLALSISMVDHFKGKSSNKYFNRGRFWEHSLGVAMLAKMLATKRHGINPEEAYLAGLLHDFGIIIMDQFFQNEFSEILRLVHEQSMPMLRAEKYVCGYDHAELAGLISTEWKYPEFLTVSLSNHHTPDYSGDHAEMANAIYLANCLEYRFNEELETRDPPEADPVVQEKFIENDEQLDILKVKFEAETERSQEVLKLFQ